ncbi:UNVERIFIED_CONTAM: hypothetical protein FKN15_067429 [Acipenser sinensis]
MALTGDRLHRSTLKVYGNIMEQLNPSLLKLVTLGNNYIQAFQGPSPHHSGCRSRSSSLGEALVVNGGQRFQTVASHSAGSNPTLLNFHSGALITVLVPVPRNGWLYGREEGSARQGWFPAAYVEPIGPEQETAQGSVHGGSNLRVLFDSRMGRKSCRKQQKQLSPQPAVATPLPPLPPGSPPSREIGDWLVHPEGKMEGWRDGCRDLEDLLGGLEDQGWCMACGVQGHTVAICPFQGEEEEEQQPGCYCCAEPGHSSTNCPWYPLGQLPQRCPICGGEHYVACCPVHQEREEQGTPQSPPPAGEGRLLLPLPQPQLQQRPEEPENLFPWCTWCGEVDHRWRDCSEVPPSWCGRCEEGGHDWSGCPYASSPVPKREEPERPQPKREEPERPQPKREEPERPQPKREEPERPQPKREEPERPQPKREEPERPQPKEEEVGASIVLGPKPPAEEECLLSPCPPAEGKCLLVPPPPAEDECLLVSLPPPAEGECLLGPRPPAEDECLLVSLPPPAEGECLLGPRPPAEDECLLVSLPPPAEGECLLGPRPPAEDECLLVSLPPPAEGECLLGPRPPAEDECLLVSLPPPAEGECLLGPRPPAEDECLLVSLPPPAEGECLLGPRPPAEDECLLVSLPPPAEDECLLVSLPPPAEDECLLVSLPPPAEDECLLVSLPPPAEDECLLVSLPPPAEDECLLVSLPPPAEDECLLSPSPPAEGECLLGPRPPAEDECLLVSLPPPALTPAREGDKPQSPARKAEPHQSPAREAEQDQSPAKGGDYTLLPPSSPGDHTLLPPPLLLPQETEGEELQAKPPEKFWGGEGQDAGVPQQPLFMLLKAARRAPAQPPQRREPAPPGAEELELPLPPVPPPQEVRWQEPQKGELPATKKGEEVWRPPTPAAVSLPEFMGEVRGPSPNAALSLVEGLWPEPHQWELPATKKGEVGGPPAPAAFSLQDETSMLSAVPLLAGVLTAWPARGPQKPPFPARDFVLDCWVFKGGGGR